MWKYWVIALVLIAVLFTVFSGIQKMRTLTGENSELKKELAEVREDARNFKIFNDRFAFLATRLKGIKARIVTNYGNIELEFFPEKAPLHCFSFITRAESGFYDNTQFHRVIPGFMIQGGDPNSRDTNPADDGNGGPIAMIPHEFNEIRHQPGILSTARVSDTAVGAGSQFFIMHGAAPQLDRQYTAFGKVTSGMEVVDKIARVKTFGAKNLRQKDHPVKPVRIKTIQVYR